MVNLPGATAKAHQLQRFQHCNISRLSVLTILKPILTTHNILPSESPQKRSAARKQNPMRPEMLTDRRKCFQNTSNNTKSPHCKHSKWRLKIIIKNKTVKKIILATYKLPPM